MAKLMQAEMEQILFAHGSAEMEFDVDKTMETVVPQPHYEYSMPGLAVDGRQTVVEMYRRLLAGNRNRHLHYEFRASGIGRNIFMQEAQLYAHGAGGAAMRKIRNLYRQPTEWRESKARAAGITVHL